MTAAVCAFQLINWIDCMSELWECPLTTENSSEVNTWYTYISLKQGNV